MTSNRRVSSMPRSCQGCSSHFTLRRHRHCCSTCNLDFCDACAPVRACTGRRACASCQSVCICCACIAHLCHAARGRRLVLDASMNVALSLGLDGDEKVRGGEANNTPKGQASIEDGSHELLEAAASHAQVQMTARRLCAALSPLTSAALDTANEEAITAAAGISTDFSESSWLPGSPSSAARSISPSALSAATTNASTSPQAEAEGREWRVRSVPSTSTVLASSASCVSSTSSSPADPDRPMSGLHSAAQVGDARSCAAPVPRTRSSSAAHVKKMSHIFDSREQMRLQSRLTSLCLLHGSRMCARPRPSWCPGACVRPEETGLGRRKRLGAW